MKLARFENRLGSGEPEIFYSLQGEGKNIGTPSIFVRLALCNLQCGWCDTEYTWNWKKFNKERETMDLSVEEVAQVIQRFSCHHVVFTGGEPLLQQKELVLLMEQFKKNNYWFEIETNGTLLPSLEFDSYIHQYNCSPKLANSGNLKEERECAAALQFFAQNPKATFKFVMKEKKDFSEVMFLIAKYKISKEKVYLMPEGRTQESLQMAQGWVSALCQETGFCFTDRLHIQIFGDRRGA